MENRITQIRKRDGRIVKYNREKITEAIFKAALSVGETDRVVAAKLSENVEEELFGKFPGKVPGVEDIQDIVEHVLITSNHIQTARAYIVYREQHRKLRLDRKTVVDVSSSVNEYLDKADWRINANANQGYSLGGLILNVSGKVIANSRRFSVCKNISSPLRRLTHCLTR